MMVDVNIRAGHVMASFPVELPEQLDEASDGQTIWIARLANTAVEKNDTTALGNCEQSYLVCLVPAKFCVENFCLKTGRHCGN